VSATSIFQISKDGRVALLRIESEEPLHVAQYIMAIDEFLTAAKRAYDKQIQEYFDTMNAVKPLTPVLRLTRVDE
jgi:hypothetical protein